MLRRPFITGRSQFPEQAIQSLVDIGHRCTKVGDSLAPALDDAIPPAFRICKHAAGKSLLGITGIECLLDCGGVGLAHQFSNELLLAPQRTTAVYRCCRGDGITEGLVDRQRSQILGGKADQSLTKVLQRKLLFFSCRFAGLCVGHGLSYPA